MRTWSKWRGLKEKKVAIWKLAVYEIRLIKNRKPVRIRRFGGTDSKGIVCIGQGILRLRRDNFYLAAVMDRKWASHSEGKLYSYLKNFTNLRKKIGNHRFEFRFRYVKNKKEAEKIEALIMRRYVRKFCEPPPLNSVIPSKTWNM